MTRYSLLVVVSPLVDLQHELVEVHAPLPLHRHLLLSVGDLRVCVYVCVGMHGSAIVRRVDG